MTALHRAIIHGHAGVVHTLLEAGCSADETDEVNAIMYSVVFIPGENLTRHSQDPELQISLVNIYVFGFSPDK